VEPGFELLAFLESQRSNIDRWFHAS
jgi:hypothetical protein